MEPTTRLAIVVVGLGLVLFGGSYLAVSFGLYLAGMSMGSLAESIVREAKVVNHTWTRERK